MIANLSIHFGYVWEIRAEKNIRKGGAVHLVFQFYHVLTFPYFPIFR